MKRQLRNAWAYDTEPVEWVCSLGFLVYGLTLLLPFETFRLGAVYSRLSALICEPLLAALLLAIGAAGAAALAFNSITWRRRMAMVSLVLYLFIALEMTTALPFTIANLLYVFAGASLWSYLRLSLSRRRGDG